MNERPRIVLRPATADDANGIAALHAESWRGAYRTILDPAFLTGPIDTDRLDLWTTRLREAPATQHVMIAEDAGLLVGFICTLADADPVWGAWVDNLHVLASARRKGVGAALLASAASWVTKRDAASGLHLWVFEANENALWFYRHLGGSVVERGPTKIPAARGATIFRLHWPRAADLMV